MQWLEYLVLEYQSLELVVHYHLKSQIGLLPHQYIHLGTMLQRWQICHYRRGEIFLNLGRSHQSIAVLIYLNIYYMALALLHALFLLAKWAEYILHQSPVKECTKLVYPSHLQTHKLAHLGVWSLSSGHRALLLVQIYKHAYLVAHLHILGHIALRQQYLALFATVQIQAEVNRLYDFQGIIIS